MPKVGVDDYLLTHSVEDLHALAEQPKPEIKLVPPTTEWLLTPPPVLKRPMDYIDGHAYAVTWIHVKTTKAESVNNEGEIVKHDPPIETVVKEMFVIRDDGVIFGPKKQPIDEIGIDVEIDGTPTAFSQHGGINVGMKYMPG